MLSERILSRLIHTMTKQHLALNPTSETMMPSANPGQKYMLYMHVPFCERLCPYCSFNRYPFREEVARPYFANMRKEMLMLKDLGYDFESIYVGGGTPTVMIDELCETLDMARDNFNIRDEKYGSGDVILERIAEAEPYFDSLNVDMIFNFPSQTEDVLMADLEKIALSGCRQTTFSPLYVSSATTRKMAATLGAMDYDREYRYYQILDGVLAGGDDPLFDRTTLWTFTRPDKEGKPADAPQIDEYQVNYDEYPAIGSGSITHLNGCLYVNNFSIKDYNAAIESGRMSIMGKTEMSKRDLMRYRFLLDLYKLRLDKRAFERDFGCSIETGLPMELAFMRLNRAFETDNAEELTLTPIGRYLTVVMYRQFLSGMNNLRDQARAALTGPERELLFGDGVPA